MTVRNPVSLSLGVQMGYKKERTWGPRMDRGIENIHPRRGD